MTTKIRFSIYEGNTKKLNITVYDENDALLDITGASITWVASIVGDGGAIANHSIGDGIEVTDAVNGKFTVTISPEDTSGKGGRQASHYCDLTDAQSNVDTIMVGEFEVLKRIN